MPPVPSSTSGSQEGEEAAFQIINQDHFSMAVVGQPILKPLDQDVQKSKPNVIVHPTRRISNKIEDLAQENVQRTNVNNDEFKNKSLCHNNSTIQMDVEDLNGTIDIDRFSKTLDSKLRKLQKSDIKQQKSPKCDPSACNKKPFVTTVKKGQFLEPPPEIASLIGMKIEETKSVKKNPKEMKKLYAFSSQPRILSRTPPKSVHLNRCEAAAAVKLIGAVVGIKQDDEILGETFKYQPASDKKKFNTSRMNTQPKWNPNFAFAKLLSCDEVDQNISSIRIQQAKRRSLARSKAINQHSKRPRQQLQALYEVPDHLQQKLLDLSGLQKLLVTKDISDATTQTDADYLANKSKELKTTDVQVQVQPTDLFDLNTEVHSIVEILVTKTIEEALIEVLEEEELITMKEQQRRFLEYMASKSSEDSLENDYNLNDWNPKCSKQILLNSYVPNLITSV